VADQADNAVSVPCTCSEAMDASCRYHRASFAVGVERCDLGDGLRPRRERPDLSLGGSGRAVSTGDAAGHRRGDSDAVPSLVPRRPPRRRRHRADRPRCRAVRRHPHHRRPARRAGRRKPLRVTPIRVSLWFTSDDQELIARAAELGMRCAAPTPTTSPTGGPSRSTSTAGARPARRCAEGASTRLVPRE
jgi:hypothetical protein